jgi:hypothetical protein
MKNLYRALFLSAVLSSIAFVNNANAQQDTWQEVYTILSTNCAGGGCHGGSRPDFNVTDSSTDLYAALIGGSPINPAALAKGDKYIDPGYPSRSFLLRKVANCLSGDLVLDQAEGAAMPEGRAPLLDQEIELIRQWIIFNAPETGVVVKKDVIDEYYTIGGVPKVERPTPPKSCEGFQLHMGPIFFEPGQEDEYFQKFDLNLPDTIEVVGLELFFNDESHHFILRKYKAGTSATVPTGATLLNPLTAFDGDKDYVMAWQDNQAFNLPNGTAYFWKPGEVLDLNLHVFNYYADKIMAGEVYLNVYTQPKGSAEKEMKSSLINNAALFIQNNNQPVTFTNNNGLSNVSLWTLTSHTHKYGINYDIFFRNAGGGKGRKIFDGTYNYMQGFDTGVYDWEHPPTVIYEPFLDMADTINNGTVPTGLIDEATYKNFGSRPVTFGFTTEDEMMIYYLQYVDGKYDIPSSPTWVSTCASEVFVDPCADTTGIVEFVKNDGVGMSLYPNPTSGIANISYELSSNATNVKLEVVNMLGEVITVLVNGEGQAVGEYNYQFNSANQNQGIYIVRLAIDGKISTQKLILTGN